MLYFIIIPILVILSAVFVYLKTEQTLGDKLVLELILVMMACLGVFVGSVVLALSSPDSKNFIPPFVLGAASLVGVISLSIWRVRKKAAYLACAGILAVSLIWAGVAGIAAIYEKRIETIGEGLDLLKDYLPYGEETKVAVLSEESSFKLTDSLPALDGATALYPVYSAFARAVYPPAVLNNFGKYPEHVQCSKTDQAFERLLNNEADIIFIAEPSQAQKAAAAGKGIELHYTPIGREAFVFYVNAKNKLQDISIEEIKGIYSGTITRWSELGVPMLGKIKPFQRKAGSGSQSALERLMGKNKLVTPLEDEQVDTMIGIIRKTADYKNYKNAIGYSFRFYSTEMVKTNRIKLLSIEGVYPDRESISNGIYPVSDVFYAVTAKPNQPEIKAFLTWMIKEQGQELVDRTGYVPLAK